jgi:hypothetical protein
MLRWLISMLLLVAVWPQVASADGGGGGGGNGGGVWILPKSGASMSPGATISVQNLACVTAEVAVDVDDGSQLGSFEVPAGSTGFFELPEDPALIGHNVTTTATADSLTVTSTNPIYAENPICSDGAAVVESQELPVDAALPCDRRKRSFFGDGECSLTA